MYLDCTYRFMLHSTVNQPKVQNFTLTGHLFSNFSCPSIRHERVDSHNKILRVFHILATNGDDLS